MEKVWLQHYPVGVPAEISTLTYGSLADLFEQSCVLYANQIAVSCMGTALTYSQLRDHAHAFAAYLQNDLRLEKGERLAIMLPNCLQYYVVMFATLIAGLTVVNVNPLYTSRELIHQVNDAGATTLVTMQNFAKTVEVSLPNMSLQHIILTELGDLFPAPKSWIVNFVVRAVKKLVPPFSLPTAVTFNKAIKIGKKREFTFITSTQEDIAFLQYTGGTTGISKGAILTHGNILANTEQARLWLADKLEVGEETVVAALPLYHIFALTVSCFIFLKIGGHALLIPNPRDLKQFIKELKHQRFTVMIGVNTLYNLLLNHKDFASIDFSKLKLSIAGGMSLQRSVADRWKTVTSNIIVEGYGLTETSPIIAFNPLNNPAYNGSVGLPAPSTDICIMDDNHQELGLDAVGELCVKGPQVMPGYWQKPDETAQAFYHGWFKTGDIAKVDAHGFVYIVDRKKDMIDVSGFNVYPNEVEAVIAQYPKVFEVAVIGVPDERTNEAVKAFIVKKDDSLTETELREYFKQTLTPYKRPKIIVFCKELPKSNVGKILRRSLRDKS